MTRLSVINALKNGRLNLTDLETQIKAIRLSWISRILDEREVHGSRILHFIEKIWRDSALKM